MESIKLSDLHFTTSGFAKEDNVVSYCSTNYIGISRRKDTVRALVRLVTDQNSQMMPYRGFVWHPHLVFPELLSELNNSNSQYVFTIGNSFGYVISRNSMLIDNNELIDNSLSQFSSLDISVVSNIEIEQVDSTFWDEVFNIEKNEKIEKAILKVISHFDSKLRNKEFKYIDKLIQKIDFSKASLDILIAILTSTKPWKENLSNSLREQVFFYAQKKSLSKYSEEVTSNLLNSKR